MPSSICGACRKPAEHLRPVRLEAKETQQNEAGLYSACEDCIMKARKRIAEATGKPIEQVPVPT